MHIVEHRRRKVVSRQNHPISSAEKSAYTYDFVLILAGDETVFISEDIYGTAPSASLNSADYISETELPP
jgi:hypothetical protein